jgi:carboxyl-terminal processing protease
VVNLVRGEVDSTVTIVVQRPAIAPTTAVNVASANGTPAARLSDLETLRFVITRTELQTPSMEWRLLDDDPTTATIGYIRHTQFTANSAEEMRTALAELQAAGAERYLLDLRGNPGGPVDAALQMADMWLDEGLILIEEHANGEQERFEAESGTAVGNVPLVVLIDGGSASASEILAGALQDHHRAQWVGEQSYGKGSVQLRYELADKSSLFVTNAKWFTPDYHEIAGTGLTPDIVVEPGVDPLPIAIESVQQIVAVR